MGYLLNTRSPTVNRPNLLKVAARNYTCSTFVVHLILIRQQRSFRMEVSAHRAPVGFDLDIQVMLLVALLQIPLDDLRYFSSRKRDPSTVTLPTLYNELKSIIKALGAVVLLIA